MLEETAQVVRVANGEVWVEYRRRSTCSTCSARNGCGTSALSKVLGKRRNLIRVVSDLPLRPGEQVVIGISERALVRGSLAVYAVPLVLLLVGALLGRLGADQWLWSDAELASTLLGGAGLLIGLYWLRRFSRRIHNDRNYQPVVLRRVPAANL